MPEHPKETIERLSAELRLLRAPVDRAERRLTEAYDELRKLCVHNHLIVMRTSWGYKRMCSECGLVEDETTHGTGFHVLKDRRDVWMKTVNTRDQWDRLKPRRSLLIEWCYGDKDHPSHWVPAGTLLKGGGTRCAAYEGSFA